MKFFKKSKYDIENESKKIEDFLKFFWEFQFKKKIFCIEAVSLRKKQFFLEEFLDQIEDKINLNKIEINSKNNPLENSNFFKDKTINYLMVQGKKQKAYKHYNNTFKLFFSFFENYNSDLNENYSLYNTYYKYAIKNNLIFFEPVFILYNLVFLLQPSFVLSVKKNVKKKRQTKKPKELYIKYIRPNSRFYFCLKSIVRYSLSFNYNKIEERFTYGLINLFLNNKNSFLFKKKITSYERIIRLKKIK